MRKWENTSHPSRELWSISTPSSSSNKTLEATEACSQSFENFKKIERCPSMGPARNTAHSTWTKIYITDFSRYSFYSCVVFSVYFIQTHMEGHLIYAIHLTDNVSHRNVSQYHHSHACFLLLITENVVWDEIFVINNRKGLSNTNLEGVFCY